MKSGYMMQARTKRATVTEFNKKRLMGHILCRAESWGVPDRGWVRLREVSVSLSRTSYAHSQRSPLVVDPSALGLAWAALIFQIFNAIRRS